MDIKRTSGQLAEERGINHALYAYDIAMWFTLGSGAEVERSLQKALDTMQRSDGIGAAAVAELPQLLLYRQYRQSIRNLTPIDEILIKLHTEDGQQIPRMDTIRILELLLEGKRGDTQSVVIRLAFNTDNMLRLILRM